MGTDAAAGVGRTLGGGTDGAGTGTETDAIGGNAGSVSAFGSASLNALSRILIILTMYLGRIGPLTMALVFAHRQDAGKSAVQYPNGQIMIG